MSSASLSEEGDMSWSEGGKGPKTSTPRKESKGRGRGRPGRPSSSSTSQPKVNPKVTHNKDDKKSKSDPDPEEVTYIVEDILDKRRIKGRPLEYLIKWMFYPENEATWEPAKNISCWDIISDFRKRYSEKKKALKSQILSPCDKPRKIKSPLSPQSSGSGSSSMSDPTYEAKPIQRSDHKNRAGEPKRLKMSPASATEETRNGFERGLVNPRIIAVTRNQNGPGHFFMVHFEGQVNGECIAAEICNRECPLVVINYYEERLAFDMTRSVEPEP